MSRFDIATLNQRWRARLCMCSSFEQSWPQCRGSTRCRVLPALGNDNLSSAGSADTAHQRVNYHKRCFVLVQIQKDFLNLMRTGFCNNDSGNNQCRIFHSRKHKSNHHWQLKQYNKHPKECLISKNESNVHYIEHVRKWLLKKNNFLKNLHR